MAKFESILPSLHFQMANVRWTSMRLSIVLLIIFQATITQSHTIRHRRQNVFESEASIDKTSLSVSNETAAAIGTENEPPAIMYENDDGGGSMDDVIEEEMVQLPSRTKNADVNEVNNINNNDNHNANEVVKVSSTTDINNVIEQSFGARNNDTNARGATVATSATTTSSSSSSTSRTSNAPTNFTKDFSHDESVENRLPSKISDKTAPRNPAKVTTVSLKEATAVVAPEKPKRLDATTFPRATERGIAAAADSDASSNPVSHSTVSLLSVNPVTPRIAATETIRARISSISPDVAEKRAKYLIESSSSSAASSPPPSSRNNQTPDVAWSNLKTVGEVHHNNVTLGKVVQQSSEEHTGASSVNGKLDIEEISEKSSSAEQRPSIATTERNAANAVAAAIDHDDDDAEHETQLQKSNSSRIADVQEDNSLISLVSSSSHRPVDVGFVTTTKSGHLRPATTNQVIPKTIANGTSLQPEISSASPSTSTTTERTKSKEIKIKTSEKDVYQTTTEEIDQTTLVAMTNDDTTTPVLNDEMTTLSQHDSTSLKTPPAITTNENFTEMDDTTITTIIPTTEPSKVIPTTIPDDENKIQPESTTSHNVIPKQTAKVTQTSASPSSTTGSSIIHHPARPDATVPLVRPTKMHIPKPTDDKQRIVVIPNNDAQPEISSTTMPPPTPTPTPTPTISISTENTDAKIPVPTVTDRSPEPMDTSSPTTPQTHTQPTSTVSSVTGRKVPESHFRTPSPADHTEIAQSPGGEATDINAMIAIGISVIAVITLILLVGFLYVMRKRQKQLTYSQRCRPIGLDAYSLDNISIYNSVRRKSAHQSSKRAFGNVGFDDPGLKNNPLTIPQLATFSHKRVAINEEFRDIPTVTARIEEVPIGCEDKNRYANVVPLPESRVHLEQLDGDEKTEYINANFVKGPKDTTHYYIACQAPLEHTIVDFWRMIWEQNSRVIIMATDLTENGIEKCAEYLPSSFVIDNHVSFGDYQITLKMREVREKYAVSMVHLKNSSTNKWREITHFWYQWPENGIPSDEASVIAMLLDARSYLKMATIEQSKENGESQQDGGGDSDGKLGNGNLDKNKSLQRVQGPLTVHCSPGTGRTGTIIACDIAIRSLELPTRSVDIPQIVYFVRRGRASAVQTREQYEFIYKLAHVYATKLTGTSSDN